MASFRNLYLKDICHFEKGKTGLAKAVSGEYPLVTTGADRRTCESFQFNTKAVCIPLVSSTGHGHASLKNVHYQEGKFALGTILVALTAVDDGELDIQFLHLYLSQLKDVILVPLMSGAANVALSVTKIKNIKIPLPSIEKQKKIVAQFKSIVAEDTELKNELTHQQTLLKKLRQQILQEAIEGTLTADWRAQNPDVEPSSALLARIKAEKEQLIKDKKIRKQKALPPIADEEKPFDLPDGWVWCRLTEVTQIRGGKRVSNGYKLLKKETPYIYIRVSDMKNHTVSEDDPHYIDADMHEKIKKYIIRKDDLYIVIVGATIGKCGGVPPKFDGMNLTENSARIILYEIDKQFLLWLLNSRFCQQQFIDRTKRVGVQKMALNRLGTTLLPLPSFPEQKSIVAKVEKLFFTCDQLEAQITQDQIHAEQLMQAVLKEAFTSHRTKEIN